MKKIDKKASLALSALLGISSLAQAGVQLESSETTVTAKYCSSNLNSNMKVTFQIGENGLPNGASSKVYKKGYGEYCVDKDFTISTLPSDSPARIIVKYGSYKDSFEIDKKSLKRKDQNQAPTPDKESITFSNNSVQVCDPYIKKGTKVEFFVGNLESIPTTVVAQKDGCVERQFSEGLFTESKYVFAKYLGVVKKVYVNYRGNGHSTAPSQPAPSPQVPQAPQTPQAPPAPSVPVDNRETISESEVRKMAEASAIQFARTTVRTLAPIEKVRYKFYQGVMEAKRMLNYTPIENTVEYTRGSTEGRYKTVRDLGGSSNLTASDYGRSKGLESAASDARSMAKEDVSRQIDEAIVRQTQAHFSPRQDFSSRINAYNGYQVSLSSPTSIEKALEPVVQNIQAQYRRSLGSDRELILADSVYSRFLVFNDIYTMKEYQRDLVLSHFRGENAFDAWMDQSLSSGYDQSNIKSYKYITNSVNTKNASQIDWSFKKIFADTYDRVVTDLWNLEMQREDLTAVRIQIEGQTAYIEAFRNRAYNLGLQAGFSSEVRSSSVRAYAESIQHQYNESFVLNIEKASSSSLISDIKTQLRSASGISTSDMTIGDELDLVLLDVKNRGLKAGQLVLSIASSSNNLRIKATPLTYEVQGLSHLQQPLQLEKAVVLQDVTFDSQASISIKDGDGYVQSVSISTPFEAAVRRIGDTSDSEVSQKIANKIYLTLKAEWEKERSSTLNNFNNEKGNLFVERLAKVAMSMSSSQKSKLKKYAVKFQSAYNEVEDGWIFKTTDDQASALEILRKAGL